MVYALQVGCTIEEKEEFEEELQREVDSKVRMEMGDLNAHARRELNMRRCLEEKYGEGEMRKGRDLCEGNNLLIHGTEKKSQKIT